MRPMNDPAVSVVKLCSGALWLAAVVSLAVGWTAFLLDDWQLGLMAIGTSGAVSPVAGTMSARCWNAHSQRLIRVTSGLEPRERRLESVGD